MRSSLLLAATIVLSASVTALAQEPVYRFGTTPSAREIKARTTRKRWSLTQDPRGEYVRRAGDADMSALVLNYRQC